MIEFLCKPHFFTENMNFKNFTMNNNFYFIIPEFFFMEINSFFSLQNNTPK